MYTKGEWTVEVYDDYTNVEAEHQTICTDVSNCDAQLIAAAPDMYEALKSAIDPQITTEEMRVIALKALAKAEGKQ